MAFLKLSLIALIVTSLSVSADPLKQKPQTLNTVSTKNAQQQVANEAKPDVIPIYVYSRENSLDGDYNFKYETGNGIFAEERGVVVNKGTEDEANSVVGSYRYVSPEGVPIEVTYTAGVDGFRAYGAHLPVAPPAAALPKNLAYKNAALSPFARPQFRAAVDDSDLPATRTIDDDDDQQQPTSQFARNLAGAPSSNGLERPATRADAEVAANELPEKPLVLLVGGGGAGQTPDKASSQSLTGETPTAANEVDHSQKIDSVFDVKKPSTAEYYQQFNVPTPTTSRDQLASNPQTSPDQSGFSSSATFASSQQQQQQQQQKLQSVENFESPQPAVSVVPVLQTVPQAVQTQPKVVPVLQRVVSGEGIQLYQQQQQQQQQQQYQRQPYQQQPFQQQQYQQQPYQQQPYQQQPYQQQQQQTRFNARPFPPAFGQQPRPAGSVRQFTVEPQQMWYMPQNLQPARHFQRPTVLRTLEPLKY